MLIVILSLGSGFLFIRMQKPVYTATTNINYIAKYEGREEDVRMSIDIMRAYVDTMVDLCTTGVVLDRADYYYSLFIKSGQSVDDFVLRVKLGEFDRYYDPYAIIAREYYVDDSVSVGLVEYATELDSFLFKARCTTTDAKMSKDMLRIYVQALDIESRDYFEGVKTYVFELVKSSNDVPVGSGNSVKRTMLLFGVGGVCLAVVVIFLKTLFDKTVKDKNQIERMIGADVLAFIEDQNDFHEPKHDPLGPEPEELFQEDNE